MPFESFDKVVHVHILGSIHQRGLVVEDFAGRQPLPDVMTQLVGRQVFDERTGFAAVAQPVKQRRGTHPQVNRQPVVVDPIHVVLETRGATTRADYNLSEVARFKQQTLLNLAESCFTVFMKELRDSYPVSMLEHHVEIGKFVTKLSGKVLTCVTFATPHETYQINSRHAIGIV